MAKPDAPLRFYAPKLVPAGTPWGYVTLVDGVYWLMPFEAANDG